jgi:hypothetical protein
MERRLETDLVNAVRDLPLEKVHQLIDFANHLRSRYRSDVPERGSAAALLSALEEVGPLEFAPGELEARVAELEGMRE